MILMFCKHLEASSMMKSGRIRLVGSVCDL